VHNSQYCSGDNTQTARIDLARGLTYLLHKLRHLRRGLDRSPVPALELAADAFAGAPLVHKVLFENASEFDNQLSALIERTRGRGLTVSGGEDASFPLQWVPVAPEPTAASNLCRMFCEYYGLRFARVFEKSLPHARGRGRYFVEELHKLLDLLSRYALGAEGENKKLHTAFNAAVRDIKRATRCSGE